MTEGIPTDLVAAAWVIPDLPGKAQAAVAEAVSVFGAAVTPKLAGPGQPEDQMRGPLETLLISVAKDLGLKVNPVGESSLSDLKVRADYAIEVDGALIGYVEVKAPGKGADPTAWGVKSHDRMQWEKLKELPNVLYTDGNQWGLYSKGVRLGDVVKLKGDVRTSGHALAVEGPGLASVLDAFLRWEPQAPRSLHQLVNSVAGLCRLLRDEVAEALKKEKHTGGPFTSLAADWRELLFPDADADQFADGYAQTVTFALLLARVERIDFTGQPVSEIARQLGKGHSLMGKALSVLTDESLGSLTRTIATLLRVVGAVDWGKFEHEPELDLGLKRAKRPTRRNDPYLHLYETFLEVYDPELRKQTGSYYTPVQVVDGMIGMVDHLLKARLDQPLGFASDQVTVVDPAMGTGTYLLNVIEHAAAAIAEDQGEGSVPARLRKMAGRVIGFERQAGPYAVAEMRAYAALRRHETEAPRDGLRLYVADTLDDPNAAEAHIYAGLEPIARSRREANKVKRDEPVLVVIGNPPYKDKAKGEGGWIEEGNKKAGEESPMRAFRADGNGKYEYVLSNLYAYFWRWATWKVFDHHPEQPAGVVAFITTSGFATGQGFAGMREYMRRTCDEGWIIDLSPEGHQPDVGTRVFPGVAQPLCIGIFVRYGPGKPDMPANIHYRTVEGRREKKFEDLVDIDLLGDGWLSCPDGWQDRFAPQQGADWLSMPAVADLLPWQSPGIKPNRTWVYSPDPATLAERWITLVLSPPEEKSELFRETDTTNLHRLAPALPGHPKKVHPFTQETGPCPAPVPVAFRFLDRHWLIPDGRLIERPRTDMWAAHGPRQVYATEQHTERIVGGPALAFAAHPPDQHHFNGRGGRVLPLYREHDSATPNLAPGLLTLLTERLGATVTPEDILAYVAAVTAHDAFTRTFAAELDAPGVRVPLTASYELYQEAVVLGREVLWLHTYGERYTDPSNGRPASSPRLPDERRPKVTVAIPDDETGMPETLDYDATTQTLKVGGGRVAPVPPGAFDYAVGGTNVLRKWFGYRKKNPAGKRTSPLDHLNPTSWSPEFTTDLLALLNVLGRLVELEPAQADLLARLVAGPSITVTDLKQAGVLPPPPAARKPVGVKKAEPDEDDLLTVLAQADGDA